jgi:hypothetical protein
MSEPIFFSVISFIIIGLLGIISYFLVDFVNEVKQFKNAVITLQITLAADKITMENLRENESERHSTIDRRLKEHGDRLNIHGQRIDRNDIEITALKTKQSYKG